MGPITPTARAAGIGLLVASFALRLFCATYRIVTIDMYTFVPALMGVFLLAGYAIAGIEDVKQTNVLKNMMGMVITTTSALTFILRGEVIWSAALPMLIGALAGGFAGGTLARVIPAAALRLVVTVGALFLTAWYFVT